MHFIRHIRIYGYKNAEKNIIKFFKTQLKDTNCKYHICLENTGKYSWSLTRVLSKLECYLYVVNPFFSYTLKKDKKKNEKY